jgi:hypothetical protein
MLEAAAVRWYFLVLGAILLALTIWNGYLVLTRRDPSTRTVAVKAVVGGAAWSWTALFIGIHPSSDIVHELLAPSVCLSFGLLLLLFPELLGPRFAMIKRGLAFCFIGFALLTLLSWPFPNLDSPTIALIWLAVVVLVCVVAKMVALKTVQRLQPSAEEEA